MRISAIRGKGETIKLPFPPTAIYKTDTVTYEELAYTNPFVLPDTDCFVILEFGNKFDVLRVGNPPLVMLVKGHAGDYKQYTEEGVLLGTITAELIFNNYYKVVPLSIAKGYFEKDGHFLTFHIPYALPNATAWDKKIVLQPSRWQLIAIPEPTWKVKENFLDKVAEVTGQPASYSIEVVNTYFGSENKFTTFVPDFTNPLSSFNFPLVYNDNGVNEVTAFWVKTTSNVTADLVIDWN